MEREIFAPWELEHADAIHAAQPVKDDLEISATPKLLLTRAGWHKRWRQVFVADSDAREVGKYWNTGEAKFLFSENQTAPTRQTRRQWENQGRRVTVSNSKAEKVPSRHDSTHVVHVFTVEQTEPI
ncbi:MAG: hypothetical protein JO119_13570 [Acidobacteria bacterium]|nr:hypothetical protein [Acidobacteriota bacterium]